VFEGKVGKGVGAKQLGGIKEWRGVVYRLTDDGTKGRFDESRDGGDN
jgi:hypothetical protein